jgi:hypothetical protein
MQIYARTCGLPSAAETEPREIGDSSMLHENAKHKKNKLQSFRKVAAVPISASSVIYGSTTPQRSFIFRNILTGEVSLQNQKTPSRLVILLHCSKSEATTRMDTSQNTGEIHGRSKHKKEIFHYLLLLSCIRYGRLPLPSTR